LIIDNGWLPDAMEPGFHGARTHWIRGFMAFQLADRPYSGPTPPDHSTCRITLRFLVVRF